MRAIDTNAITTTFNTFALEAINDELKAREITPVNLETKEMGAHLLARGVRTIDEFTATMVNLSRGEIGADLLKAGMITAFPTHKIGDRHPNHYLCLARTGSIGGTIPVRFTPNKAPRKGASRKPAMDLSGIEDAKLKKMVKAVAGTPLEAILIAEVERREAATEVPAAE